MNHLVPASTASISTQLPPPKRGTPAHFAGLVRFDMADTLRSLGLPCAARIARDASTPDDWRDIAAEVRALTVPALRAHEQRQVVEACGLMADRRPAGAAWELLQLRDLAVTDTLEAWVAAVEAEMREVAR